MNLTRIELERQVVAIVADALGHEPSRVTSAASLVDDLGAESIDFLDIVFRLESAFDLKIPEDEIWAGAAEFGAGDDASIAAGLATLRERRPDFDWGRFPSRPGRADLARLITVQTILDYLEPRLLADAPAAG